MTAAALDPPSGRPAWPLLAFFTTYLAGWALGLSGFLPAMFGAVMLWYLRPLRAVTFPRSMLLWWWFLVLVVASVAMVDTGGRLVGSAFRLGTYVAAAAAFVYVYDSRGSQLSEAKVARALTFFWISIVVGGYLGVLLPTGGFDTPLAAVLPSVLADNELVRDWIRPRFTEFQSPWLAATDFARPSAPFPYTNNWGNNFALLVPFVAATVVSARGWRRAALLGLLGASVVPAVATLNRGMFLALGVGLAYTVGRLALRGRWVPFMAALAAGAVGAALLTWLGAVERIRMRTEYSTATEGRASIYRETFDRTLESPLLGWGAPRPSHTLEISVGTQGHLWNVMFSHGFVALVLFLLALSWFTWRTRNATGVGFAAHVTLVMVLVTVSYYGYSGPQLIVAMTAAGIGMRQVDRVVAGGDEVAAVRSRAPLSS